MTSDSQGISAGEGHNGTRGAAPWDATRRLRVALLVLALDAIGEEDRALGLLADMQHLRDNDGSYWTGYVFEDDARWPLERSTWTGAAVVLAVDALSLTTPASGIFRAEALPTGFVFQEPACGCERESLTHPLQAS